MQTQTETKTVMTALVGRPNAGKSSLVNALLHQKVAIVSDKPQTTRTRMMGVLTEGAVQYIFIDTPGFHRPRTALGRQMMRAVDGSMEGVDVCLLVADCTRPISPVEEALAAEFARRGLPAVLALNKIDLLKDKSALMPLIARYSELYSFAAVLPLSARTGDGVAALPGELAPFGRPGPHLFDEDALTDQSEQTLVAELVREKLLRLLSREVPHGVAVVTERFSYREDPPLLTATVTIYCEKPSHKGMIIGKDGGMLKQVGSAARVELERLFDCPVNLQCWVKVRENWRNREGLLHTFGLDS